MTRKDYILISDAIRDAYLSADDSKRPAIDDVIARLVRKLSLDNPRFDAARFVAACTAA